MGQAPVWCYLTRVSPVTRRVLQYRLEQLASWLSGGKHTALSFPWHQLDYSHVMALRAYLQEQYKVSTANAYLKNVRVMARECWRLGLMSVEQFSKVQGVPNIPGESLPAGREVRPHELMRLFATIAKDTTPMGGP
jgi:hypothetical protein